ncbi:hypothetical protein NC652_039971 [Populus alba x Populus x berolinensis]|nr:hypothetical protein NC652_039971 [Populus alba x Populus x berolinensis]
MGRGWKRWCKEAEDMGALACEHIHLQAAMDAVCTRSPSSSHLLYFTSLACTRNPAELDLRKKSLSSLFLFHASSLLFSKIPLLPFLHAGIHDLSKRSGSPDKTGIGVEVKFLETATKTLHNGASWPNIRLWIQGTAEFVYLKQLLFSSA